MSCRVVSLKPPWRVVLWQKTKKQNKKNKKQKKQKHRSAWQRGWASATPVRQKNLSRMGPALLPRPTLFLLSFLITLAIAPFIFIICQNKTVRSSPVRLSPMAQACPSNGRPTSVVCPPGALPIRFSCWPAGRWPPHRGWVGGPRNVIDSSLSSNKNLLSLRFPTSPATSCQISRTPSMGECLWGKREWLVV